jgi:hypothetical protein
VAPPGVSEQVSPPPRKRGRSRRYAIPSLIAAIAISYVVFPVLRGPTFGINGYTTEYYALLANGFLHGATSLPIQPRPELLALPNPYDSEASLPYRLHDASLYHGKYYLYFGPAPAVFLFVPFRLLTGTDLPNRVAVPILCLIGFLASCALFRKLAAHEKWKTPLSLEAAVVVLLGCSPFLAFLLDRPSFYEVAVAGGYCLVALGFLFSVDALSRRPVSLFRLALAGLCFGAGAGCRPHLALISLLLLALVYLRTRSTAVAFAFGVPVALCGILLAAYNYVRFHNPFESGISYQVTSSPTTPGVHVHLAGILPTIARLLFTPPSVDAVFPFLHAAMVYPYTGYRVPSHWFLEQSLGVLVAAPIAALGLAAVPVLHSRFLRMRSAGTLAAWAIDSMSAAAILILFALGLAGWVVGRYTADFGPLLVLAGCCLLALLCQSLGVNQRYRAALRFAALAAAAYSALLYLCILMPRWQHLQRYLHRL